MNRSAFLTGLAAASFFALSANAQETRTYDLPAFERINISAGIKLVAKSGDAQSVVVETDEGDFEDLKIKVKDDVLVVSREWNRLRWHQKKVAYKVIVSAPRIAALDASSGSYSILDQIDSRRFSLDLSSGSFVEVNGRSEDCTVDISSGANLKGRSFICDSANVDVSSGGHGELSVLKVLVGDASSGGHVAIYGSPVRVNIDRSSGGRIKVKPAAMADNK